MMVVVVIPPSNMSSRIPAKKIYNEYKVWTGHKFCLTTGELWWC
jgi:hypothetical protein